MRSTRSAALWVVVFLASFALAGNRPGPGAGALAPEVEGNLFEAKTLGLYRAPARSILTPFLAATAATHPGTRIKAWVFFTDKGMGTAASYDRVRGRIWAELGDAARDRRAALGPDLGIDFFDAPVHRPYVEALKNRGLQVRRVSRWLNAASVEAAAGDLRALADLPFVHSVRPLLVLCTDPVPPEPDFSSTLSGLSEVASAAAVDSGEAAFYGNSYKQLDQIQVLALHRLGYSGAGVRVLMLDTGFLGTHPALARARIIAAWDFINNDGEVGPEPGDPVNQEGHGTGCLSVLGGYAPGRLLGPAFAAEFVLAKTEDISREVRSEEDNFVAALEWGDTLGVAVASSSLGYWTFDDHSGYTAADMNGDVGVTTVALDIAASRGIACVSAAGNSGPGPTSIGTPADADSCITVGAVDSVGTIQGFSSRGPTADGRVKPEICSRGRNTWWARAATGGYGTANGTSLATPLIGGLAALIKEAHPDWTGYRIRQALIATGTQAGAPDNARGYGIAQGLDAVHEGSEALAAPRMSRPFHLVAPAEGALVNDASPHLIWQASGVDTSQAPPNYRVILAADSAFSAPDTFAAGVDTSLSIPALLASGDHWWRVEAVSELGYARPSLQTHVFKVISTVNIPGDVPAVTPLRLRPAFPNPARGAATFLLSLPSGMTGRLEVFTVEGRLVRSFPLLGHGGDDAVIWDGRDKGGRLVPAGMYPYRLTAGDQVLTGRLTLLP